MTDNNSLNWKHIFNSIKDSIVLLDTDGFIKDCNETFKKLINKTSSQIIGYECSIIIFGRTEKLKNCPFLRSKISKKRESLTVKKDGRWFKVDVDPMLDKNKITGFVLYISDITDQREAEKVIEESEDKFRTLVENINVGIYRNTVGQKGKFIEANPAIVKMFGFKNKEEFLAYNVSELYLHTEEREIFNDGMLSKGFVNNKELLLKRTDGTTFLGSISAKAIKDKDGNVQFYDGIIEDITERKKMDESLLKSEKKYRDLFEKSRDAILIIKNGNIVDCNQATVKMLQYSKKEDLLNIHPSKLSPEKQPDGKTSFQKANEMMKIAFEKGSHRFEWDHKKSNGEVFPVEVLLTSISSDEKNQAFHTVWRDITERKKANMALQKSENRFKYLFEQSPVSIWEEDFSEVYKYLNVLKKKGIEDFADYFGKHPDEVRKCSQMVRILDINEMTIKIFNAKTKNDLITSLGSIFTEGSLQTFIGQLCTIAKGEVRFKGECINKTLDGKLINVFLEFNVVPGYEKDYSRVLISLIDITEQKRAEEDLRNGRERLKMLNKIIRHDIANDFIVIKSAINIYRRASDAKMIDEIERRVDKSLNTIDNYRKYESFIDLNQDLYELEIAEVLNDIIAEFPKIKFNIHGECKIFADNALDSVFTNLISNSIKHGNSTQIDIKISSDDNMCKIKYMDNGTGIPNKIKDKVFEEGFFHGKAGHTGIGLYIIKQTIERYGGSISIEDNKPSGAIFIINLKKAL